MEIVGLLAPSAELNDLDRLLHQRSNSSSALFSWRIRSSTRSYTENGHVSVMLLCKECFRHSPSLAYLVCTKWMHRSSEVPLILLHPV